MDTQFNPQGAVTGTPKLVLQAESAMVLAASIYSYAQTNMGWLLFAVLFLTPDIFMLGYLKSSRVGAIGYNFGHTYLTPAILFVTSLFLSSAQLGALALIWICHIGFDRAVGYGLKYAAGFKSSHLGNFNTAVEKAET